MTYPDFAFSSGMQLILLACSVATSFLFFYLVTNVILRMYGQEASKRQKIVFVLLTSTLLNNVWTYGMYLLGGRIEFAPLIYALVTVPNPVFAALYYCLGIKVLRLSPYRSLHLMTHAYTYVLVVKLLQRAVGATFFPQTGAEFNYLLDAISLCACTGIFLLIYQATNILLTRAQMLIRLGDRLLLSSYRNELILSAVKCTALYAFIIVMPILLNDHGALPSYLSMLLGFLMLLSGVLADFWSAVELDIGNKDAHIHTLTDAIDGLKSIEHSFHSILQSYGGYLEAGDLAGLRGYHASLLSTTLLMGDQIELSRRMEENPALISLLQKKKEYAQVHNVQLRINLMCPVGDLYINNMDGCRVLACLLDNAVEAAEESAQRNATFSIEQKNDKSKLIIITNTTRGTVDTSKLGALGHTTKAGHTGLGLTQVRKTLGKYRNCAFHFSYYQNELSAFIEIKPVKHTH